MTWEEYVNNYVRDNIPKEFSEKEQDIINYLLTHKDKVVIKERKYDFDEIYEFMKKEKNVEDLPLIIVSDEEIIVRSTTKEMIDSIIENLSRTVRKLEIPKDALDKIDLSEFKELEEIILGSPLSITEDLQSKTKNSNIKKIVCKSIDKIELKEGIIFKASFYKKFVKEGLVVEESNFSRYANSSISVNCNNPYVQIKEIMKHITVPLSDLKICNGLEKPITEINYRETNDNSTEEIKKQKELIFVNFNSIREIINVLDEFEAKGIPIDKVSIGIENKDYEDIFFVKDIENRYKCSLLLDNNVYHKVSLTDFIAMRETLNYYKNLILEANLSNVEKIMYAYDLIKSFKYQEDEENKSNSRFIYNIIREGKIVCAGYAHFFSQLLKEVGIDSFDITTTVPVDDKLFGHARNLVMVEDDKYGLDGLFAFDPTWDSAHSLVKVVDSEGKESIKSKEKVEEGETIIKCYDDLSLYEHFLVSEREYQTVFEGERMPNIEIAAFYSSSDKSNKEEAASEFSSSKRVGFDTILRIVSNVKLKMGYSKEDVLNAIKDIVEIHEYKREQKKKTEDNDVVIKR